MALRRPGRLLIDEFRGLDSFSHPHDLAPDQWEDANNVLVNATGSAECLRSPKSFGSPITGYDDSDSSSQPSSSASSPSSVSPETGAIISMDEYKRLEGHLLFVDWGADTFSYEGSGSRMPRRSDQAGDPWTSVNVNNRFQRIDGHEFIQYLSGLECFRNGIDPPAAAPDISYVADESSDSISDDCSIEESIQVSYAYKNSTTGHIGQASPISNVLSATEDDHTLRIPVVASTQPGVDKIVFFITTDGGSIPYLALECGTSDVYEVSNTTGNVDIPLCAFDVDTLTPETIYNVPPPTDATHMFTWKDRIVLIRGRFVQYSAWEVAYAGNAYECWPPLNALGIPNKSDVAISGISTQLGALIFGREDSFLISGYPSDKVSSPNNTLAVTEHMDPLNWGMGIYASGKDTPALTPFGVIWLDQTKKLRLWDLKSFPQEIAVGLRNELKNMTGTITARWHPHGENSGYYVIRNASKVLFIIMYQTAEGKLSFGFGKSDISTSAMCPVTFTTPGFFIGFEDQVYKWLDPNLAGDGWPAGTELFFKTKQGNDGNFSYFHSMSAIGTHLNSSMRVLVNGQDIPLEADTDTDGDLYGVVDQEGRRHSLEFRFNRDDTYVRAIDALQLFLRNKKRVI